jgi:hypothetical protein
MAEGWTLYTFCTFIVVARVFTQIKLTQNFGTGDIVMIGALVSRPQKIHFKKNKTDVHGIGVWTSPINNANIGLYPRVGKAFFLPHR